MYVLAPADFQEEDPNEVMRDAEWIESSVKSLELSPWRTLAPFICETAAAAGAVAHLAQECVQGVITPERVVLYSDNAGTIQVLQGIQTRKHNAWRKTVGVGWWGIIQRGLLEITRRGWSWGPFCQAMG